MRRAAALLVLLGALGAVPRATAAAAPAVRPFFDARASVTARIAGAARVPRRPSLGRDVLIAEDPVAGTARQALALHGALAGPASGTPRAIAWRYLRAHAAGLGLDAADLRSLVPLRARGGGELTVVRWAQAYRGVRAFDNGLAVGIGRGGRVVSVAGAARHGLRVGSVRPRLPAAAARTAAARDAGVPPGAARDVPARLVLFGARTPLLAWEVRLRAAPGADYETLIDARSGAVLHRQNLVKGEAAATIYPNYPGASGAASAPRTVDLEGLGYLPPGASILSGRYAHTYVDASGDLAPRPGEEVGPSAPGSFVYPLRTSDGTHDFEAAADGCSAAFLCTWDPAAPASWHTNAGEVAVELQWLVSTYHDHLAAAPINFTDAAGNFEQGGTGGSDPVSVNAEEGAATGPDGGPDASHINNAFMDTRADGTPPIMAMYLNAHSADLPERNSDNGNDARTVYHEYTHGLSSRLVADTDGTPAVSSPQAGAMGEGWSDFYALDFLARQGIVPDNPAVPGEEDFGAYSDAVPHTSRSQPIDCPVGASAPACPGAPGAGPGGYTYGDFGRIAGRPEVHADGEIWGETLWDLRQALVVRTGSDSAGSDAVERLVTDAMRLSPPEPSMLDERNAILAADEADYGGGNAALIWGVFRHRGMGYYAAAYGGEDVAPVESFAPPPPAKGPVGVIRGTVTDAVSGLPVPRADVALGGHATSPDFSEYLASIAGTAGDYVIAAVPPGTYPKLSVSAPGYDRGVIRGPRVRAGRGTRADARLRRNWAVAAGRGRVAYASDTSGAGAGCGANALIDGSQATGWETENRGGAPAASAVIGLSRRIDVSALLVDPGNTCGDGPSATTKDYRVETSADGLHFRLARAGAFAAADAGHLRLLPLAPAARRGVRFVRVTLLSPQRTCDVCSGSQYVDLSELEVLGAPRNVLPRGRLRVRPGVVPAGRRVLFDASFRDRDSRITGYAWDFDGDGRIDRRTAGPTVRHVFRRPGRFRARVRVLDFRGGSGAARARLRVTRRR